MADDSTKLSPHLGIRKKRSVQFLVDCHLGDCQSFGGGGGGGGDYQSSHEGDNLSVRSLGSAATTTVSSSSRLAGCSVRCASPRVCSSSSAGVVDSGDESEDGCPISISRPADAPEDLAVFEVGLGMLRQHTVYEVQFLLPAAGRLSAEAVEVIRSNVIAPSEGRHFERSAEVDVKLIDYLKEDSGRLRHLTPSLFFSIASHVAVPMRRSANGITLNS